MRAPLLIACFAITLLSSCSSDKDSDDNPDDQTQSATAGPGKHVISSADGSISVTTPDDWASQPENVKDPIVIVAQGEDRINQIVVSRFDGANTAEDESLYNATGMASGG